MPFTTNTPDNLPSPSNSGTSSPLPAPAQGDFDCGTFSGTHFELQLRRGPTSDRSFTPLPGEPLWDATEKALYVGDGTTIGGVKPKVNIADVTDLQTELDSFIAGPDAPVTTGRIVVFNGTSARLAAEGTLTIAQVLARSNHTGTQLASTISDFDTAAGTAVTWSTLSGKPPTFPPSSHTHPQSEIDNLESDLETLGSSIASIGTTVEGLSGLTGVQSANTVLAGPDAGPDAIPTFRSLVAEDLPANTQAIEQLTYLPGKYLYTTGTSVFALGSITSTGVNLLALTLSKGELISAISEGDPTIITAGSDGQALVYNGTTATGFEYRDFPETGITSIDVSVPNYTSDGPLTSAGTVTLTPDSQLANLAYMSTDGTAGVPLFRSILNNDLPVVTFAKGGTGEDNRQDAIDSLLNSGTSSTGDLYYRNSSGNVDRIPIGSNGQYLRVDTDTPAWMTSSGGSVNASDVTVDGTAFDVLTASNAQDAFEEIDQRLLNARQTGIRYGGIVTADGGIGSGTTISVTAGSGEILDISTPSLPVYSLVNFSSNSSVPVSSGAYHWYIDSSGTLQSTTTAPDAESYRTRIWLASTSLTGGVITAVTPISTPITHNSAALQDLSTALGAIKISGSVPQSSGANLKLKISAGKIYYFGVNRANNPNSPNIVEPPVFDSGVSSTFRYITTTGVIAIDRTDVRVANYQVAGTETAIPGATTRVGMHFVLGLPSGNTRLFYGNAYYTNFTDAITALVSINPYDFLPGTFDTTNSLVLGVILATSGATDLSNSSQAQFISTNRFGEFNGGAAVAGGGYLLASNNLSDLTNASQARDNLGVSIGTSVQAFDSDLLAIAGLTYTKGNIIVANGTTAQMLTVGANDLPLIADSAQTLGVKWAALPIAGGGTGQTTRQAAINALALSSPATGDVFYYNGTNFTALAKGTNGQVLTSGTATISWKTPSSSSGVDETRFDARLSVSGAASVPSSDVTSAGTVYLVPNMVPSSYGGGSGAAKISLYTSSVWTSYSISAAAPPSLVLSIASGTNYDIFAYDSGGSIVMESVAWSSDTTRSTGLSWQDGVYIKNGETNKRYVGTIRGSGSNVTEDSLARRYVWNLYNQVERTLYCFDATANWNQTVTSTWRETNGGSTLGTSRVAYLVGLPSGLVKAWCYGCAAAGGFAAAYAVGVGIDSTTNNSARYYGGRQGASGAILVSLSALYTGYPGMGYHVISQLEWTTVNPTSWRGSDSGTMQTGMVVNIMA